jgi:hypothetical protein
VSALKEQCDSYAKERAALTTILDSKIRTLLGELHRSVSELPDEVNHSAGCGRIRSVWQRVHGRTGLPPVRACLLLLRQHSLRRGGSGGTATATPGDVHSKWLHCFGCTQCLATNGHMG